MNIVTIVIDSIIMISSLIYIGKIIFYNSKKINYKKTLFCVLIGTIITSIVNVYNEDIINNTLRVMILFITFSYIYKILFRSNMTISLTAGFTTYLIYIISEVILDLPLYLILKILNISVEQVRNTILINFAISALAILLTYIFKTRIRKIIISEISDIKAIIIISILILFTISLLVFIEPINNLSFNINFVVTMLLLILFCVIGFIILKQKLDIKNVSINYSNLVKYSKTTEKVLENYRINVHENKNQLIVIDGMIPQKYKEVHDYIHNLIESKSNNKYSWISELKYIPLPELKTFINYKLMEMDNDNIKFDINISRTIHKKFFKQYKTKDKENLYSIVGVLLDNAHDAAKKSKPKEVSIQLYPTKNELKLIIANTFKGKINLDQIDNYGYSSKGSNHGTGLHLVKNIININKKFVKSTKIIDKYFVQEITICK